MPASQLLSGEAPGPIPTHLRLVTLGDMRLIDPATDEPVIGPGKPLALLCYLAMAPARTASRDHLIDLLWADLDPTHARHALRQTLWLLRQSLGDDVLGSDNGDITLLAPLETDRDRFLSALDTRAWERAVEVYTGPFIPTFAAPGGAEFEHWADLERARLAAGFRQAASALVRRWWADGSNLREAQRLARRLTAEAPEDQSAWRLLLETDIRLADPVSATIDSEAFERILAEHDAVPEPASTVILGLARRDSGRSADGPGDQGLTAELVGREEEFAAILGEWEAARQGKGRAVGVVAPAGLGKTRLLQDVARRIAAIGGRMVEVRANPGERTVPSALAADLARALCQEPGAAGISRASAGALVGLNPALASSYDARPARASGPEATRDRTLALLEVVEAVADECPLALMVDDVHWADGESRQILESLTARMESSRAMVLWAARPARGNEGRLLQGKLLTLEPLTCRQVGQLVGSMGRFDPPSALDELATALCASTFGSPLLVLETLQSALDDELLRLDADGWRCDDLPRLTAMLRAGGALTARIERLPDGDRRLLQLLATAGTPLQTMYLADAAGVPAGEVNAALHGLEHVGLVEHADHHWGVAHDEIADAAVAGLDADQRHAADGAIGTALATHHGGSARVLARAAGHLQRAGDREALGKVIADFVVLQRRRGDRRSLSTLASELLSRDFAPHELRAWSRRLPLRTRLGLRRWHYAAAALMVIAGLAGGMALRDRPVAYDAALEVLWTDADGDARLSTVRWSAAGWRRETPLAVPRASTRFPSLSGTSSYLAPESRPGASTATWAVSRATADSGVNDLFLLEPDLDRRLTHAPGDDGRPSWSPDGRSLAFITSRFSLPGDYIANAAILDIETGEIRPLTTGPELVRQALWSPDGTRIAIARTDLAAGALQLCLATPAGDRLGCLPPLPEDISTVQCWPDADHLLVAGGRLGGGALRLVPLDGGPLKALGPDYGRVHSFSPDCRWGLQRETVVRGGTVWSVFPFDRPDQKRRLVLPAGGDVAAFAWDAVDSTGYVDSLAIVMPDTIAPGFPHRPRLLAFDTRGRSITVPRATVRWSGLPGGPEIDPLTGSILADTVGAATIAVTAGGWRSAMYRFQVSPIPSQPILTEDWTDGWLERWDPFGDPGPRVVATDDGGFAMHNNGDGTYHSGVMARQRFDASIGLGVEYQLSAPVTDWHWQKVMMDFSPLVDSAKLAAWDRKTGYPPSVSGGLPRCSAGYPGREDTTVTDLLASGGDYVTVSATLRSGEWHTVRLQLFPDGSCGVAIDGAPLHRSPPAPMSSGPYFLSIRGNSVGTDMLVGKLTVWSGVPTDVDWQDLEEAAPITENRTP